jgi:hypothetical protein
MSLHMQMDYVGARAESTFFSAIPSSLKKGFGIQEWMRWQGRMSDGMFVPVDQSKFDHVPSGRVLSAAFRLICDKSTPVGDVDRERVGKALQKRLKNGFVTFNGKTWRHRRGVLSGWRWTSLIDTVINYAEHVAIAEQLNITIHQGVNCYQGDDTLIFAEGWDEAACLVETYRNALPVNPSKFFLAEDRTEYLRLVLYRERDVARCGGWRRRGYPARAVMSLMYANAWAGGTQTASSIASGWSKLSSRTDNPVACWEHCIRDICGFMRCTRVQAIGILKTPKNLGGLGYVNVGGEYVAHRIVQPKLVQSRDSAHRANLVDNIDPALMRRVAANRMTLLGGDEVLGTASARAVLRGLKGLGAEDKTLSSVEKLGFTDYRIGIGDGIALGRPPGRKSHIPFSTWSELVVWKRGDPQALAPYLIDATSVETLIHQRKRLPRWLYIDWLCGRLTPQVAVPWGVADDVLSFISKRVRGEFKILPDGRVTTRAVRARMCVLEMASASLFDDRLLSFGG